VKVQQICAVMLLISQWFDLTCRLLTQTHTISTPEKLRHLAAPARVGPFATATCPSLTTQQMAVAMFDGISNKQ
jgi:hypothetical protein